eukprot:5961683-Amphidinium_carterae.1
MDEGHEVVSRLALQRLRVALPETLDSTKTEVNHALEKEVVKCGQNAGGHLCSASVEVSKFGLTTMLRQP